MTFDIKSNNLFYREGVIDRTVESKSLDVLKQSFTHPGESDTIDCFFFKKIKFFLKITLFFLLFLQKTIYIYLHYFFITISKPSRLLRQARCGMRETKGVGSDTRRRYVERGKVVGGGDDCELFPNCEMASDVSMNNKFS